MVTALVAMVALALFLIAVVGALVGIVIHYERRERDYFTAVEPPFVWDYTRESGWVDDGGEADDAR